MIQWLNRDSDGQKMHMQCIQSCSIQPRKPGLVKHLETSWNILKHLEPSWNILKAQDGPAMEPILSCNHAPLGPPGLAVSRQEEKQQTQQDAAASHEKPADIGPVHHTCWGNMIWIDSKWILNGFWTDSKWSEAVRGCENHEDIQRSAKVNRQCI